MIILYGICRRIYLVCWVCCGLIGVVRMERLRVLSLENTKIKNLWCCLDSLLDADSLRELRFQGDYQVWVIFFLMISFNVLLMEDSFWVFWAGFLWWIDESDAEEDSSPFPDYTIRDSDSLDDEYEDLQEETPICKEFYYRDFFIVNLPTLKILDNLEILEVHMLKILNI